MRIDKIENWNRQEKSVIVIDKDGKIIQDRVMKDGEEVSIGRKLTDSQIEFLKQRNDIQLYSNSLGGHIHMTYVKNELLFNELNLDRSNISRVIYLSTFIDFKNRNENLLVKHSDNYIIKPMDKKDIKNILKLKDRTFREFMKSMKDSNLIWEVDNKFYINNDYFSKGKCDFNKKEYTRIFINTTRLLYENCSPRKHKQLSYIFQLIPFMNYELNILCKNPKEMDFTKLDKLSLLSICDILGVSTEKHTMRKFRDELLKFEISVGEKKYFILSYVKVRNGYGIKDYFVINPMISWGGKNLNLLQDTIQTCFFQ